MHHHHSNKRPHKVAGAGSLALFYKCRTSKTMEENVNAESAREGRAGVVCMCMCARLSRHCDFPPTAWSISGPVNPAQRRRPRKDTAVLSTVHLSSTRYSLIGRSSYPLRPPCA